MAAFNHTHFKCCFENWIAQQYQDLEELLSQLSPTSDSNDEKLQLLVDKSIKHFEEYAERRALMVHHDAPSFLFPSWCSLYENTFLWIGGCRASLSVRLVYSICGLELNDHLMEFCLAEKKGNLADISAQQLQLIDALHGKTIRGEDNMSTKMATLQEEIAELPMLGRAVGESSEEVEHAIDAHRASLASMIRDADRLRLSTLKELMDILSPQQCVDLLATTKKLHLSMHEWGKRMHHRSEEKETVKM